jgi:signal peptide peptidase SppA
MKHLSFLAWAASQPWAMMPDAIAAYSAVLVSIAQGERPPPIVYNGQTTDDRNAASAAARSTSSVSGGQIAVIPINGTIVPRMSQLDMCEEGTSTALIRSALADANANPQVAQILMPINSPGGSVYDVPELAAEIASNPKPVVAFAQTLAASAGYWLGCAAGEMYAAPSAEVGSIGVWTAHQNVSEMLKARGIDITLITAGKYKVEGNPFGALPEDAKAFMQSRINDYYSMFTKAVAKSRKVGIDAVRDGMGQGRVLGAAGAAAENMIDGVMTLDQVIAKMQKNIRAGAKPAQSAVIAGGNRAAQRDRDIALLDC